MIKRTILSIAILMHITPVGLAETSEFDTVILVYNRKYQAYDEKGEFKGSPQGAMLRNGFYLWDESETRLLPILTDFSKAAMDFNLDFYDDYEFNDYLAPYANSRIAISPDHRYVAITGYAVDFYQGVSDEAKEAFSERSRRLFLEQGDGPVVVDRTRYRIGIAEVSCIFQRRDDCVHVIFDSNDVPNSIVPPEEDLPRWLKAEFENNPSSAATNPYLEDFAWEQGIVLEPSFSLDGTKLYFRHLFDFDFDGTMGTGFSEHGPQDFGMRRDLGVHHSFVASLKDFEESEFSVKPSIERTVIPGESYQSSDVIAMRDGRLEAPGIWAHIGAWWTGREIKPFDNTPRIASFSLSPDGRLLAKSVLIPETENDNTLYTHQVAIESTGKLDNELTRFSLAEMRANHVSAGFDPGFWWFDDRLVMRRDPSNLMVFDLEEINNLEFALEGIENPGEIERRKRILESLTGSIASLFTNTNAELSAKYSARLAHFNAMEAALARNSLDISPVFSTNNRDLSFHGFSFFDQSLNVAPHHPLEPYIAGNRLYFVDPFRGAYARERNEAMSYAGIGFEMDMSTHKAGYIMYPKLIRHHPLYGLFDSSRVSITNDITLPQKERDYLYSYLTASEFYLPRMSVRKPRVSQNGMLITYLYQDDILDLVFPQGEVAGDAPVLAQVAQGGFRERTRIGVLSVLTRTTPSGLRHQYVHYYNSEAGDSVRPISGVQDYEVLGRRKPLIKPNQQALELILALEEDTALGASLDELLTNLDYDDWLGDD